MLNIQNPRGIKYKDLKDIFGSQDSYLKEKVSNGIISNFGKDFSSDFLNCLDDILAGNEVINENNVANATLEYIFDYGNISKELNLKNSFYLDKDLEEFFKKNFNSIKTLKEIFFGELPNDFFIKQNNSDEKIGIIFIKDLKELQNILSKNKNIELEIKEEKNLFNLFGLLGSKKNKNEKFQEIFKQMKENIDFCVKNELDMIVFSY